MPIIAPSILSANFANLERDLRMAEKAGADWIHVDVMDGHFVPNITIGPVVVEHIRKITERPLDVHLMISDPDRYLDAFRKAGADIISVHQEACTHLQRTLHAIRELGAKAGVVINPATSPHTLEYVLDDVDLILVMSVNPGFGGQRFIESSIAKIRTIKGMIGHRKIFIEVDGGITDQTGLQVLKAGANVLVSGSYIFSSSHPEDRLAKLKHLTTSTLVA